MSVSNVRREIAQRMANAPIRPATSEARDQAVEALRHFAMTFGRNKDPRAWAYRLRDRENRGEHLTPFQRDAWREAINGVTAENRSEA